MSGASFPSRERFHILVKDISSCSSFSTITVKFVASILLVHHSPFIEMDSKFFILHIIIIITRPVNHAYLSNLPFPFAPFFVLFFPPSSHTISQYLHALVIYEIFVKESYISIVNKNIIFIQSDIWNWTGVPSVRFLVLNFEQIVEPIILNSRDNSFGVW